MEKQSWTPRLIEGTIMIQLTEAELYALVSRNSEMYQRLDEDERMAVIHTRANDWHTARDKLVSAVHKEFRKRP